MDKLRCKTKTAHSPVSRITVMGTNFPSREFCVTESFNSLTLESFNIISESEIGCKSSKNVIFGIFECFSWYERERSRCYSQQFQKCKGSSPKPLGYCYIMYCPPEKSLESLFGRILYEKSRFLAKLTQNHYEMLPEECWIALQSPLQCC